MVTQAAGRDSLPASIQSRLLDHPCYSEPAHHHFARLHVAVAPACNIQCRYCNRKYDCSNESRPGVVSQVLTPEQAVRKTLALAAAMPNLAVVGIAGPGDPLANPERLFATFQALAERAPDLKLCVSTNGLMLPRYVDELVRYNVGHVTITINCIDPAIGAEIYPWIFWNRRRSRGREAAAILIEQQQQGLEMLAARGVLVKVNSVMIPGVNDEHLKEVNRVVKQKGAFLHNIMPLIARPEHGTYYGVMGQREPSAQEVLALQEACGGSLRMMRHCRQCRSDAVGMLGQDRGGEFSPPRRAAVPRRVLMAVASKGNGLIDEHFGHAREFLIYEASSVGVRLMGHRNTDLYCAGQDQCGDPESTLAGTLRALAGCEVVLCARIGYQPWGRLEAAGIQPNSEHALEPIEAAVAAVYRELLAAGKLTAAPVSKPASA